MRARCTWVAAVVLAAGCATPREHVDALAHAAGFQRSELVGDAFRHLAFFRPGASERRRLHIYIEHDGRPWLAGRQVAGDPSPRDPLALRLMALDAGPALYLGRPCYFGLDASPPCGPLLWTHARYGEAVVDSMAAAIRRFLAAAPFDEIVLVGHSGGGTLALLMAERVPQTVAVVTIAANLDVAAWSAHHGFTALHASLDPAVRAPLPRAIAQRHYVGTADRNVPPALSANFRWHNPAARFVEIAGFDHACCWESIWPDLLASAPFR